VRITRRFTRRSLSRNFSQTLDRGVWEKLRPTRIFRAEAFLDEGLFLGEAPLGDTEGRALC
jgi:hypothetical protein